MLITDIRIFELVRFLIFRQKIKTMAEFCREINMSKSTISKIKEGSAHFTICHIESIIEKYDVNANWIFGKSNKLFNTENVDFQFNTI